MSDARWLEIDASIASAARHFAGAVAIFEQLRQAGPCLDVYITEGSYWVSGW